EASHLAYSHVSVVMHKVLPSVYGGHHAVYHLGAHLKIHFVGVGSPGNSKCRQTVISAHFTYKRIHQPVFRSPVHAYRSLHVHYGSLYAEHERRSRGFKLVDYKTRKAFRCSDREGSRQRDRS